ncbi:MAG: WecB/TagA/CpsF family glycosyltransferase [Candidatus Moraniibacteriota bacterium]|nr:MAG: WecB/TagA/CpsF family glycosyltransferase [Candidatus Moranbacteria bacterium]
MYASIFGIPLDVLSKREVTFRARLFLKGNSFHRIATVGPEFLLLARESELFRRNLLAADMCIPDGFGVTLVGWFGRKWIHRYPGSDLMEDILQEAERRHLSVFLAIWKDGLSSFEEIRKALRRKYPQLNVVGNEFEVLKNGKWRAKGGDIFLDASSSHIVLCNFGAPEQEYFLESLRGRTKSVRLVMGVGGAFDFLTGNVIRAPRLFRMIGIEWLWRLLLQPKRWRRIWRAVVVFPLVVLKESCFGKNGG